MESGFDYPTAPLPTASVVTPPLPVVTYPEVGARLLKFANQWQLIGADEWVVRVVTEGYRLEFTDRPEASVIIRPTPLPGPGAKRDALLSEVQALLKKDAIYPLDGPVQPGFSAIFFLAPKKTGDWRPIINLKPLNAYIKPQKFRMETLAFILQSRINGCWATSIDLKDAYLHIPIHPSHHRWLRFSLQGQAYAFRCLPFGLSTAPRVFTRVVMSIAAFLRKRGVKMFVYLDDWLILAPSRQLVLQHTQLVLDTAESLGFVINRTKSQLEPSQNPAYLGAILDLTAGVVTPSLERVQTLTREVLNLLTRQQASARTWLRCLGLMASMVEIVPLCRLRMRLIQLHLAEHYKQSYHSLDTLVPVSLAVHPALRWWTLQDNLLSGVRFPSPSHQLTLTTDASGLGWGGTWELGLRAGFGVPKWHNGISMFWNFWRSGIRWRPSCQRSRITRF